MKLLIDAHSFDRTVAEGITTHIKGIYSEMPALAPDIDFYFAASDTERLRNVFGSASNIHYVRLSHHDRFRRLMLEYPQIIRRLGIDMAHFQYFAPPLCNCRTIITMHDVLFKDFPSNFPLAYRLSRDYIFRNSARKADILATVSEYSGQRISQHYDIPAQRIVVTPNAVSSDFYNQDREKSREEIYGRGIRPFLLNVSRIEPRKNQIAVVRAFAELNLARRGYDLVLINQPAIRVNELENYIASLPAEISEHIHRLEGLPHHEVKKWYSAASLFVFPSLAEGFGIPPLEAAATRIPVICHNETAMSDFTFFGENLIDVRNIGELKRSIDRNLDSPPAQAELDDIADFISKTYNWRKSAEILLEQIRNFKP